MKAFYFQHVQTIHGICVLYDAKKEQSLQNMLPRCDGNESQKTVLTHTCRVKSHVFSLECLSMDVFIKMIQGVFGLGNCVNYLFGHQGILVIGLIILVSMIFTAFSRDLGKCQYSHSIYLDVSQK